MAQEVSADHVLGSERSGFRAIGNPYQGYQAKRRREALQRQKAARLLSASRARTLAFDTEARNDGTLDVVEEASGVSDGPASDTTGADMVWAEEVTSSKPHGSNRPSGKENRKQGPMRQHSQAGHGGVRAFGLRYGNELMQPEWMTEVPRDLANQWLVMPRPEGMRCLLVTSRGRTVSWLRNGAPLHRFHSPLPGGSPASAAGCGAAAATAAAGDYCILDCIFHPQSNTYYIQDLLCWRGYALYDCAAEFRAFWLASKLQEEGLLPALTAVPSPAPGPEPGAVDGSAPPVATTSDMGHHDEAAMAVKMDRPRRQGHPGHGNRGRRRGTAGGSSGGGATADVEMGDGQGAGEPEGQWRPQREASVCYRIVPLPLHPCTLQGLLEAYGSGASPDTAAATDTAPVAPNAVATATNAVGSGPPAAFTRGRAALEGVGGVDFVRDGLYFLHRQGHYVPGPAPSPLALLWKDLGCSRYLVDTDPQGLPLEHQLTTLTFRADRTVATEDDPPVVLGRLPEAFVAAMGDKLRPGRLLRFSIRQGGITFHDGRPVGADLYYEGPANQRRGRADTFSKVLFQRLARTSPITLEALAAVTAAPVEAAMADDAGDGLSGGPGAVVLAAAAGGDVGME